MSTVTDASIPSEGRIRIDATQQRTMTCGICQGRASLRAEDLTGYRESTRFDVYECKECHAAFCDPLASADDLYERIYESPDRVPGYDRYAHYGDMTLSAADPLDYLAVSEDIYWGIRQALTPLSRGGASPPSVLDVGCGLGYLTYALRTAGYDCLGIDLSSEAVTRATARYGGSYRQATLDELAAEGRRFDVVVMAEVIEHVADPTALMGDALRVLSDRGTLIVTTPNRSAYAPDVIWTGDRPPIHLWWLSEDAVQRTARDHEGRVEFVDFSAYNRVHRPRGANGWCQPDIPPPVFAADWRLRRLPARRRARRWVVRRAKDAAMTAGILGLARRIKRTIEERRGGSWPDDGRRGTMVASITRVISPDDRREASAGRDDGGERRLPSPLL